ncbi:PEP-CTERM sorting domain-containing protein [Chamaesiphon sp. VAR_48_metabat_135_sub]|uniref:PEP-CTERM sorting domain-containing protein n=1 Tax=Chamaesiphon sp. VAR_48_metabat_135_sub TaxID=2964699 RepID=UPI00286D0A23|nr:PEP-CTERM sorting domain-containing protein [Chamaesiphon sp. VAR_48_metabat_135_sub]
MFEFTVGASGPYDFLSTTTSWNNFTVLYQNAFDSGSPLTNALVANNDKPTNRLSGFDNISLSTGTNYFFVTTGNGNGADGTFTNTITGPGPISAVTPVPEPATILGSLVAFGYGVYFNRKMKSSTGKKDS